MASHAETPIAHVEQVLRADTEHGLMAGEEFEENRRRACSTSAVLTGLMLMQPFLRNLFSDPAIIRQPAPVRVLPVAPDSPVARAIAPARTTPRWAAVLPCSRDHETGHGARHQRLRSAARVSRSSFIAMRYWKPFAADAVREVKAWGADKVDAPAALSAVLHHHDGILVQVLVGKPAGRRRAAVCCYPDAPKFLKAHAERLLTAWQIAGKPRNVRPLLSAHGLPEIVVKTGDPYQWQVERTVKALEAPAPGRMGNRDLLPVPRRPAEMDRPRRPRQSIKGGEGRQAILVSPIAFVSST